MEKKNGYYTANYLLLLVVALLFVISAIFASFPISQVEKDIFSYVNGISLPIQVPIEIIMYLGTYVGIGFSAVLAFFFKKKRLAFKLVIGGVGAWLMSELMKGIVGRPRPSAIMTPIIREVINGLGFPSGHAAVVTAFVVIAAPLVKKRYQIFLWILVLIIAFGRVYLGVHFPLDVIGGCLLGAFVGLLVRFPWKNHK
jgi:membrane-associated phospholipid phosphatase